MSCFIYYGHFYRLTVANVEYRCRSTLEIIRSCNQALAEEAAQSSGAFLLDRQPNAVFVMLNPGSSRPCNGQLGNLIPNPCQIDNDARSNLVLTCPDDTQQAVEKVMTGKQFDHVRVLNLFDIRERKSTDLATTIRASLGVSRLSERSDIESYSIFSSERRCEFRNRLNARTRIVIAAWGIDEAAPFFRRCYQILDDGNLNCQIHGWQHERRPGDRRFRHPARVREEWPRYIMENWPDEQDAPRQGQDAD